MNNSENGTQIKLTIAPATVDDYLYEDVAENECDNNTDNNIAIIYDYTDTDDIKKTNYDNDDNDLLNDQELKQFDARRCDDDDDCFEGIKCGEIFTFDSIKYFFFCACCLKPFTLNSLKFLEHIKSELNKNNLISNKQIIPQNKSLSLEQNIKRESEEHKYSGDSNIEEIEFLDDIDDDNSLNRIESVPDFTNRINEIIAYVVNVETRKLLKEKYIKKRIAFEHKKKLKKTIKYKCGICNEMLRSKLLLIEHKKNHNIKNNFLNECKVCNKKFRLKKNFLSHQNLHKIKSYKCNLCTKLFASCAGLKNHMESHENNSDKRLNKQCDFPCRICSKILKSRVALQEHFNTHTGAKPYKCETCGKHYNHQSTLVTHRKLHDPKHRKKMVVEKVSCEFCGKEMNLRNLKNHYRNVHENNLFPCPECGKKYRTKYNLMDHMNIHKNITFSCDLCDKIFIQSNALFQHKRKEHEARYACHICDKKCYSLAGLKDHINVHKGEKPLQCDICGTRFIQKIRLQNHIRVHENKKEFECEICQKRFNLKLQLRRHVQTHSDERNYQCNICLSFFKTSKTLSQHKLIHLTEYKFSCDLCGKKFSQHSGLYMHKKIHNSNRQNDMYKN